MDSPCLVIYDAYLAELSPEFQSWISRFPHRYGVQSGEKLKELTAFPHHFAKLARIAQELPPRELTVVAVGGGSVGDFAGFFASVYKRGVRLVHIPSTWLAAIDSAHGGKTALNNGRVKNQLGTFYPADRVILTRSLLDLQPPERVRDAFGELGKIALIDGGPWVSSMEKSRLRGAELLWKYLKPAVRAKEKVVEQDPYESTGHRQLLNLGHTIGHVFEAHYQWTHGQAVAQGLFFALDFAASIGRMKARDADRANRLLTETLGLERKRVRPMAKPKFLSLLLQDKKRASARKVTFLMPVRIGEVERVSISLVSLEREARRQGWVQA